KSGRYPTMTIEPRFRPVLDPEFVPASLWNRAFRAAVHDQHGGDPLAIALERGDGAVSVYRTAILPHEGAAAGLNERYVERLVKFLLWQKGGWRVTVAGDARIADFLRCVYGPGGTRAFDSAFMGDRVYGHGMTIAHVPYDRAPEERECAAPLGR